MLRALHDAGRHAKDFGAFGCVRVQGQAFCDAINERQTELAPGELDVMFARRYRNVIVSPGPTCLSPSWLAATDSRVGLSEVAARTCPLLEVNMTCIWRNVIGTASGSSRSSRNTSWKWVAARTLGQFGPRLRRCLRTPQNRPAPSESAGTKQK
jgi:hypothetical protein